MTIVRHPSIGVCTEAKAHEVIFAWIQQGEALITDSGRSYKDVSFSDP